MQPYQKQWSAAHTKQQCVSCWPPRAFSKLAPTGSSPQLIILGWLNLEPYHNTIPQGVPSQWNVEKHLCYLFKLSQSCWTYSAGSILLEVDVDGSAAKGDEAVLRGKITSAPEIGVRRAYLTKVLSVQQTGCSLQEVPLAPMMVMGEQVTGL